jgi:uncharacterized glyoxalase superfamily protein PhnB
MDINIHYAFLPHTDADAALAFYRDTLGFELRNDVGYEGMRWLTVGPSDQSVSIVLHPPAVDPGITDEERATILELIAKGSYGAALTLATDDLDGLFKKLVDSGADVLQEPTDQPYGVRDCAFRDPTGNLLRINEVK